MTLCHAAVAGLETGSVVDRVMVDMLRSSPRRATLRDSFLFVFDTVGRRGAPVPSDT
jgi:hypothetical protein